MDQGWRDRVGINRLGKAQSDHLRGDDEGFDWADAFRMSKADVAYVWHGCLYGDKVQAQLQRAGFDVRQQIVWVKPQAPLGRAAYHWRHETCWYAVAKGKSAHWIGGRSQTTVWEAPSPKHIMSGSKDGKFDHPTQKPLLLSEIPIKNHLGLGGILYDPFGGSGSSLVACEKLGRRCLMMEIEPYYCDIIIERWEKYTGKVAELLD